MGLSNTGFERIAVRIGSNIDVPTSLAIGSGSGTFATTQNTLIAETDRNVATTTDFSVLNNITWTANFSSTEMSGTDLKEFGLFSESGADTGSLWNREEFPSVTFDGSNEMELEITYKIGSPCN